MLRWNTNRGGSCGWFCVCLVFKAVMMNQSPCQAEVSKLPTNLCCLRPTEMSGSWLSAPGGELPLQKHSDSGSDPNGCPEFSSVTLFARNNGRQMLESFYLLNVDTPLFFFFSSFFNGFSVQIGQWQHEPGQTTQAILIREQCGTAFAGWTVVWSLEMWWQSCKGLVEA